MRILLLGGTRFVGRHLVAECLGRGDAVTVLHRGRSVSPLPAAVRHVVTDRRAPSADAAAVLAEPWDVVIDTCATDVDDLRSTTPLLRAAARYVLLSTCSVYSRTDPGHGEITEQSPTIRLGPTGPALISAARRLACERFLHRHLTRDRVPLLIARLGLVVGPCDYSDRLAYWLEHAVQGGDMLVPLEPAQPLQLADVRDVARSVRNAIDRAITGVVNVVGPRTSAQAMIDAVTSHARSATSPCWVSEEFALAHGVRPWTQVPLWIPARSPERALMSVGSSRTGVADAQSTPLDDTVADCLTWWETRRRRSPQWLGRTRELRLLQQRRR